MKALIFALLVALPTSAIADSKLDHILTGVVIGEVTRGLVNHHRSHNSYRPPVQYNDSYRRPVVQPRRAREVQLVGFLCDYGRFTLPAHNGECKGVVVTY